MTVEMRFILIEMEPNPYNWVFYYKDRVDGELFKFEITQIAHDPHKIIQELLKKKLEQKRDSKITMLLSA